MTHRDATALIDTPGLTAPPTQQASALHWADLGCGEGTFTLALAEFLPPGSTIEAIDLHPGIRQQTTDRRIEIRPRSANFVDDDLRLDRLDGILMANALHYVREQASFLQRLHALLKPGGIFLLVEYDTDVAVSRWVPYPLSFATAGPLFDAARWAPLQKIGQRPSAFGRSNLYSAIATRR